MVTQHKMFDVFSEYTRWVDVLGVATIGVLNTRILEGGGGDLIKIAEAFHEKKLASIADQIAAAHETGGGRIVLIADPSSSGKTTFAKRLGIQLRILGLHPVRVLSLIHISVAIKTLVPRLRSVSMARAADEGTPCV